MGREQAVVGLAAIAQAAGMTQEDPRHDSYHRVCYECRDSEGYSEKEPDHEACTGRCGQEGRNGEPDCKGPCPCPCSEPLDKNEIMKLRSLINKLSSL